MSNGLISLYEHHLFLASLSESLGFIGTVVEPASSHPVPRPMRAGIVVAHVSFDYPSGQRMADRIYVLADGSIVERGTHEELMDLHGTYAQLYAMQAELYR